MVLRSKWVKYSAQVNVTFRQRLRWTDVSSCLVENSLARSSETENVLVQLTTQQCCSGRLNLRLI